MMQVPLVGLEPTRCKATVSKTAMSTNSIIKAFCASGKIRTLNDRFVADRFIR